MRWTMTGHVGICCVLILVLLNGVKGQVCTRIVHTSKQTYVTYTAMENVCESCPVRNIQKTSLGIVPYTQIVTECCSGYVKKHQGLEPSSDNCVPLCGKNCINGQCSTGNECVCFEGYKKHPNINTCVYKCNQGYRWNNEICEPICSQPCPGGRCIAPDNCSCDHGWTINEKDECIQIKPDPITCYPPCGNGTCYYGNTCTCLDGYELIGNETPRCVPACKNCKGTCVAPGKCQSPELDERKYVTVDGRECDNSTDCDTKCCKTLYDVTTSASIKRQKITSVPSDEPQGTEALEINVVVKRISRADKSKTEPVTDTSYDEELDPWLIIFIFTTLIMVALIVLVIWEVSKFMK